MGLSPIVFRPAKEVNDTKIYIKPFRQSSFQGRSLTSASGAWRRTWNGTAYGPAHLSSVQECLYTVRVADVAEREDALAVDAGQRWGGQIPPV